MPGSGDPLKKVNQGDPLRISHETFNTFIDTAQIVRAQQHNRSSGPVPLPDLGPGLCYIQNNSGSDLDRFAVLGLDVATFLPSDNADTFAAHVAFSGLTPAAAAHLGKFAVLLEPCAKTNMAVAVVSGVVPVKLNVQSAGDTYADVDDGSAADLKTGESGAAQILWKESGTGLGKWGIVRINTPVRVGFWARLTSVDNVAPYYYGWVEQYETGGADHVLADKPGGRSGTVLVNYAVNALDDGVYGPLKLAVSDIVWMEVTSDPSGPVYRFYAVPALSFGTYCNTGPNYVDVVNIAKVRFDVDQFFVERDTHTGQSDGVQISWNGFTTGHTKAVESSGLGPTDKYCFNEILDWVDANQGDGFNPGVPKPAGATAQKPTGTGLWEFGIYWGITNTRETDYSDCATCSFRADKGATQIAGSVLIDPCKFLPIVKDCTGTSPGTFSCVQTLNFAGFTVTGSSGGSGSPGSATITFDLTVGTGDSYLDIAAGATGCGKVINLCTRTVTPVATTVVTGCDGSGNPTYATIYSLPTSDSLVVLADCHS